MSRRLSEMAAETIESGSPSDRRLMQDLGFSEELKKQLEERIEQASFKAQTRPTSSQVPNPVNGYLLNC